MKDFISGHFQQTKRNFLQKIFLRSCSVSHPTTHYMLTSFVLFKNPYLWHVDKSTWFFFTENHSLDFRKKRCIEETRSSDVQFCNTSTKKRQNSQKGARATKIRLPHIFISDPLSPAFHLLIIIVQNQEFQLYHKLLVHVVNDGVVCEMY